MELFLFDYKSAFVTGLEYTSLEIQTNKKIRTKLSVNENCVHLNIPMNTKAVILGEQNTQKSHYDKNSWDKKISLR